MDGAKRLTLNPNPNLLFEHHGIRSLECDMFSRFGDMLSELPYDRMQPVLDPGAS